MQQESNREPRYRAYLIMLFLGLAVGLALTISYMNARLNQTQAELAAVYSRPVRTDTVLVNRVFRDTVRIVVRSKPKTVYIYTQPDTVRRKRLEGDTLIGGVRLDSRKLELELLTPKGSSFIEVYPLENSIKPVMIQIGSDGIVNIEQDIAAMRQERSRRRWVRIKIGAAVVVGLVIGMVL